MFGEDPHGSIVQRGFDEALACQDMLEHAPAKPSWTTRLAARIVAAVRSIAHRKVDPERQSPVAASHGTH